ncbi:Variant surface glycoprotein [Trypanosoma congolense IL3000]|uniref:Variant surface glycoprotein n=1 Tax=Trypanosoma congolense (strain IL3000) TaxID=1068625 RepID=F9W7T7_TRYCI|nr:Variant surface glycoprotein [Trypanosoma congolense IL3000]
MMRMKIWMVVSVAIGVGAQQSGTNHNSGEHHRLCTVLKAAVSKWENSGGILSHSLKKALHQTIFGNESGGNIEKLRKQLPEFYDEVLKGSATRFTPCGGRESGHSASYDMVCLCTAGENGWPVNNSDNAKLCGKNANELGVRSQAKGWYIKGEGKDQITATWTNVTSECLHGDKEKGEKLKDTLKEFIDNLNQTRKTGYSNIYRLGEGDFENKAHCDGSPANGLCVMYYNGTQKMNHRPWWEDLEKAIPEEERFQEEKKKREEEERRKQQEKEKHDILQAAALTSSPATNQTDQQHNKANITTQFHRLNITSGTPTSMPSSWLLSAALLI